MLLPPPSSTLFPYTTLFRSSDRPDVAVVRMSEEHGILDLSHTDWRPEVGRSEEHTSELQSRFDLVCRLLLEKKKQPPTKRCGLNDSHYWIAFHRQLDPSPSY